MHSYACQTQINNITDTQFTKGRWLFSNTRRSIISVVQCCYHERAAYGATWQPYYNGTPPRSAFRLVFVAQRHNYSR